MNNPSLSEYMAQSHRGIYQSVLGPDYMMKQSYFTVDTSTGIFNATYGRKVWHALNNQTRFFNAVPRTVWGTTAGWRVRTDRGSGRSRPVTETGSLPTVDISNIETVSSLPRIVSTTFGASVKSVFTAGLEGGVGDVLALENENAQVDHVKEINEELLAGSSYIAQTNSTTTEFVVPPSQGKNFKIGDTVTYFDDSSNAWEDADATITPAGAAGLAVSAVASGTVTIAAALEAITDGDLVSIYSRAGLTSIDDVVMEDGANVGGTAPDAAGGVRAYDLTYGVRTAGTWNAGASVSYNAGIGRDLTLQLLDNAIMNIRQNGGEPKLILMGHDQYFRLERLLNAQQRYMGQEEYQVGIGSERTYPGTRTGMVLATYLGIPILPDNDVAKSVAADDAVLGQNIYVLDTDYMEMAVAQPTQYVENRDFFAVDALVVRGLLYTLAEMRVKNIFVQSKIADLNA